MRRAFVLWRAFAFIAGTRLCALVEACVCKEAVMITVRLQCLVPRRFGVEDANYDGRLLLPILRHEKWVILHVRNCLLFFSFG